MITLEEAMGMFQKMIDEHPEKYTIFEAWEIPYEDPVHGEDPLYIMTVLNENGEQFFPGEVFKSIRKRDGELVNFEFPVPG